MFVATLALAFLATDASPAVMQPCYLVTYAYAEHDGLSQKIVKFLERDLSANGTSCAPNSTTNGRQVRVSLNNGITVRDFHGHDAALYHLTVTTDRSAEVADRVGICDEAKILDCARKISATIKSLRELGF